jgi:hypothetical protein
LPIGSKAFARLYENCDALLTSAAIPGTICSSVATDRTRRDAADNESREGTTMTKTTEAAEKAKEIATAIRKLETMDDLRIVSDALKARWSVVQSRVAEDALAAFNVGDTVKFSAKGRYVVGRIVSLNRKTASVETAHVPGAFPMSWRVSPGLLKTATAEEYAEAAKVSGVVR